MKNKSYMKCLSFVLFIAYMMFIAEMLFSAKGFGLYQWFSFISAILFGSYCLNDFLKED